MTATEPCHTMETRSLFALVPIVVLPLAAAASSPAGVSVANPPAAVRALEARFPYAIPVRLYPMRLGRRPGDRITITSVRGDRPRLEKGGTYLVRGTYVLRSAPAAVLNLSVTTEGRPSGPSLAWKRTQVCRIEQGHGAFTLIATMRLKGWFHVSFCFPSGARRVQGRLRYTSLQPGGGVNFINR